ncbi:hypothetical protein [Bacillus sp. EB01]|uniref:hypothetical protein n=1 Tax=Bacillus sp. EB01 TaxID=1347086 RepID=UPI0005C58E9C|nr:hypothetical protein [Bacillus sp. EB01]
MEVSFGVITLFFIALILLLLFVILFKKKKPYLGHDDNLELTSTENAAAVSTQKFWEISSYSPNAIELYKSEKPLVLNDNLRTHIDRIVKLSPNAKDIVKSEKRVVVKFSDEVFEKIKSGEYKIMKKKGSPSELRSIVVDQKNRIREHGWVGLQESKKINPMQLANVAFGALTVITAQEHLDRINKQLITIDRKIDKLLNNYHYEMLGKVQGNIRYLKSLLPEIGDNIGKDKENIYFIKIEDITLQCYQDIQAVLFDLPKILKQMNSIKEKKIFWGIDKIISEIEELSIDFQQKLFVAFGNIEVMSICLKMRTDLDNGSEANVTRLADLEEDYNKLLGHYNEFIQSLTDKRDDIDVKLWVEKAINKRREKIEKQLDFHKKEVRVQMDDVGEKVTQFKTPQSPYSGNHFDLTVEYDDNDNVKAVYQLERNS